MVTQGGRRPHPHRDPGARTSIRRGVIIGHRSERCRPPRFDANVLLAAQPRLPMEAAPVITGRRSLRSIFYDPPGYPLYGVDRDLRNRTAFAAQTTLAPLPSRSVSRSICLSHRLHRQLNSGSSQQCVFHQPELYPSSRCVSQVAEARTMPGIAASASTSVQCRV